MQFAFPFLIFTLFLYSTSGQLVMRWIDPSCSTTLVDAAWTLANRCLSHPPDSSYIINCTATQRIHTYYNGEGCTGLPYQTQTYPIGQCNLDLSGYYFQHTCVTTAPKNTSLSGRSDRFISSDCTGEIYQSSWDYDVCIRKEDPPGWYMKTCLGPNILDNVYNDPDCLRLKSSESSSIRTICSPTEKYRYTCLKNSSFANHISLILAVILIISMFI